MQLEGPHIDLAKLYEAVGRSKTLVVLFFKWASSTIILAVFMAALNASRKSTQAFERSESTRTHQADSFLSTHII
jgi:hypothetical protein